MRSAAEKNSEVEMFVRGLLLTLLLYSSVHAGEILIDKEFTVPRGDYKEIHYLIPEDQGKSFQLDGHFTCRGGFNDDVSFLVLTKDQFVLWYTGHRHKPLFKLEKKTEGKFSVSAKPGETYYFVFDNFFSTVSHKQVKLQVRLNPASKEN